MIARFAISHSKRFAQSSQLNLSDIQIAMSIVKRLAEDEGKTDLLDDECCLITVGKVGDRDRFFDWLHRGVEAIPVKGWVLAGCKKDRHVIANGEVLGVDRFSHCCHGAVFRLSVV